MTSHHSGGQRGQLQCGDRGEVNITQPHSLHIAQQALVSQVSATYYCATFFEMTVSCLLAIILSRIYTLDILVASFTWFSVSKAEAAQRRSFRSIQLSHLFHNGSSGSFYSWNMNLSLTWSEQINLTASTYVPHIRSSCCSMYMLDDNW